MALLLNRCIATLIGLVASQLSFAGAAQWSSTNVQYLYGDTYTDVGTDTEVSGSVITLEHVNGWAYGDNFFFVDITNPDRGDSKLSTGYYGVRTSGPEQPIAALSGGNVQRVVLARELAQDVSILVVLNPCFGLDFKAVADIRAQLLAARNRGTAILLISEDLDEILELSDRFYVISEGQLVYQTTPKKADMNTVGQYMAGH